MPTRTFAHLPVKDLDKSIRFFEALGYAFNPQFTDATEACMIISEDIYVMLLTHAKFKEFTKKTSADATTSAEVPTCLSMDSRERFDALLDSALKAGATEDRAPMD